MLEYIRHNNILVRHSDLNVICGQQLVIPHVVFLDPHECGTRICLGIAVPIRSADFNLPYIFLQLAQILFQRLIMTLFNRLPLAFPMLECREIHLRYECIQI